MSGHEGGRLSVDSAAWAHTYDASMNSWLQGMAPAMRLMTVALAGIAPGEAVLDVGCGTGDLTMAARLAAGATSPVHGIDALPEMIAVARRKAAEASLAIDYEVASVEALPFADGTFDVVVNSLMMHHLPTDLQHRGAAEMRRVLKPGGRLLIIDIRGPQGHQGHHSPPLGSHHHAHAEVPDHSRLLEAAGFTAIEAGETELGHNLGFTRGRVAT